MKKISLLLVILILIAAVGSGCGNNTPTPVTTAVPTSSEAPQTEPTPEVKDTLIIGSGFDIDGMDPHNTGSLVSMKIVTNIYDTLFKTDPDGNISKHLVESYTESEDKKTYTFKLKEGVMFHNGEELKASDAVFSILRGKASPFAGAIFMSVEGAEVIDEYSFTIKLKYPYAPFLYAMSTPLASMVNEKAVTEAGEDYSRKPVGTAAYKLVKWDSGDRVVLEAFDNWHMGDVPIKNIIFRVLADPSTAIISLESGEIDLLLDVSTTDRQKIVDNPDLELYDRASHLYNYLGFNMDVLPFSDARVREAIASVINRESIAIVATDGVSQPAKNHLTDSLFGYSDKVEWVDSKDVEKAKGLLSDAGYADGFSCNIIVRDVAGQRAAQVLQEDLTKIGIVLNIEVLERAAHLDRGRKGDFDLTLTGWSSPVPDADYSVNFLFHSSMIGSMNLTRYNNPKMDELILEGQMELDPDNRAVIYEEILQILKDDMPTIPLYYTIASIAANKDLKNVKASPSSTYYFYELSW